MSWIDGDYLKIWINWSGDKKLMRSNVVAGMQIEIFERSKDDRKYGFKEKWQYNLNGSDGQLICWGMARKKAAIKNFALEALKRRIKGE